MILEEVVDGRMLPFYSLDRGIADGDTKRYIHTICAEDLCGPVGFEAEQRNIFLELLMETAVHSMFASMKKSASS